MLTEEKLRELKHGEYIDTHANRVYRVDDFFILLDGGSEGVREAEQKPPEPAGFFYHLNKKEIEELIEEDCRRC